MLCTGLILKTNYTRPGVMSITLYLFAQQVLAKNLGIFQVFLNIDQEHIALGPEIT